MLLGIKKIGEGDATKKNGECALKLKHDEACQH